MPSELAGKGRDAVPPFLLKKWEGGKPLLERGNLIIYANIYKKIFKEDLCFSCGKEENQWNKLQNYLIKNNYKMERNIKLKNGFLRIGFTIYTNSTSSDEELFEVYDKNPRLRELFEINPNYKPEAEVEVIPAMKQPSYTTDYKPKRKKREKKKQ